MQTKKIYYYLTNSQSDVRQFNLGTYSSSTWQYQDTSTDWKSGHLPPEVLSDLDYQFSVIISNLMRSTAYTDTLVSSSAFSRVMSGDLHNRVDANPYNRMSGSLEGYHLSSEQNPWNVKEEMQETPGDASSDLMLSEQHKNDCLSFNTCNTNEACLVLRVPPENRFRYRYDTEMSGTHGSLQGIRIGREKSVPTVELINYPFEALVRVTLVTCQENEHHPHPHSLFVREKLYQKKIYENWDGKRLTKTGHFSDPHYIKVGRLKNDYTARFEGMCIINSKKENFHSSVKEKLQMRCCQVKNDTHKDDSVKMDESENLIRRVETAVSAVDVDFVSLCFEAFREEDGKLLPICQPVYSEPIGNAKSAKTGKLKISRINKCSGSCKGGDEIWLLVEKINKKGLVVRFSEEYNGKIMWESCIQGDDLILHHQYAIIFKTPPYRDINIISEVEVLMRLERTTQPNQPCDYSEPITFVYEPSKVKNNKGENLFRKESILAPFKQFQTKRPRTEFSASPLNSQTKRRNDDLELESMEFEESDEDIEQLLFDGKDSFELDQAWGKFNVEEFLRFISSDDIDMPLQRDGIPHYNKSRRDLFYKLYLLYSRLDENDMKKLTDQIGDFRVSKKDVSEGKGGMEKDQVKDAASTLLTLRSKAMVNNINNSINSNSDELMMIGENKTDFPSRSLAHNKTESFNQISESSCEPDFEAQNPVHMSVIKFNLSKFPNQPKDLNECGNDSSTDTREHNYQLTEKESLDCRVIKREKNLLDCLINDDKMENVCQILNANGSWRNLAELWNCTGAITPAKESSNPAKHIFEYIKQVEGGLEPETLKQSLEAINEKKALELFNELSTANLDLYNEDL